MSSKPYLKNKIISLPITSNFRGSHIKFKLPQTSLFCNMSISGTLSMGKSQYLNTESKFASTNLSVTVLASKTCFTDFDDTCEQDSKYTEATQLNKS